MKACILTLCLLPLCCWSDPLTIAQMVAPGRALGRGYPNALPSLLETVATTTGLELETTPMLVDSFQDPRLQQCPFLYVNWNDREDWESLPPEEAKALGEFLRNGGFLWLDAGIAAEFLRQAGTQAAQHHSYGEWQVAPEVQHFLQQALPDHPFLPLSRKDPLFQCFYQDLPDVSLLPQEVQTYVTQEKWPGGTYSVMAIRLEGRIAVMATPILAMGWGKTTLGGWTHEIRMKTLEQGDTLEILLPQAAVLGPAFPARREDGTFDKVFCQQNAIPAWLQEPTGQWRLFRYHDSPQINDFIHLFYSRLATNFLLAALMGE